jgi:23S rRNA (guanine745-N1)-methyltransferase
MLADVLPFLRCPVCRLELTSLDAAVRCPRGHSFDRAKQGYVHLTANPVAHPGDDARMVEARAAFLAAGHYDFVAGALAAAAPATAGLIVDVGAGIGYHLAAVLDARPEAVGLAVDASKPALRRAARAHPRIGAVLADTWVGLPVADGAAAVLLNVFAPRNGPEFARVLARDGVLVVVTPTADHLAELVSALGLLTVDPAKEERVAATLSPWFVETGTQTHRKTLRLTRAEVAGLVGMGPSAWHLDPGELSARIAPLPEPVAVTACVRLSSYSQVPPEKLIGGGPQGRLGGKPDGGPGGDPES